MSPASSSLTSSDPRLNWRKRKNNAGAKRPNPVDDEEEEELEEEEMAAKAARKEAGDRDRHQNIPLLAAADPILHLRECEVIDDDGQKISDFPFARRRSINRLHSSVLALVAAERRNSSASSSSTSRRWAPAPPFLENISHGQLQALSAVLPDNPSLLQLADLDKPSAYVCKPPPLMQWKGIEKSLDQDQVFIVPMHANWFSASSVHRLERQVVPHFFNGKSPEHIPERYIMLRNKIISMYIKNPGRRLSLADCQDIVPQNDLYDLGRIVRFLDNWGIINYQAALSVHHGLRMAGALLREDVGGEIELKVSPLRSIDSVILFDRPKSSLRPEDITSLSSSSSLVAEPDSVFTDLDSRIRDRLAENTCNYCSRPLPGLHYQSEKEADIMLCSDCFHDGKFVTGHSSIDFIRVDSKNENPDPDGDCWTDGETLRLLEAIEKYRDNCNEKTNNDSWNAIAEYVGTRSKAQCMLHFVRLPMEDNLLENIDIPHMAVSSNFLDSHDSGSQQSNSNDNLSGVGHNSLDPGGHIPFADSPNPVMSLVAFLTSALGPRIAAACAKTALTVLTKGDSSMSSGVGVSGSNLNIGHNKDGTEENQAALAKRDASPLSPKLVNYAATCGLSEAAMKAKLFADQDELEIQSLSANIVNHQIKRLELKLKQIPEVETLLLKECEHAERMRQRFSTEKIKMMSVRLGPAGGTLQASTGVAAAVNSPVIRQPTPVLQGNNMSPAYANNSMAHIQTPFVPRSQVFSFGPRLPLSAIHPSQSGTLQNGMFNSNMSSTTNHPVLLRLPSGNNSSAR